jgi:hypothetical protein
MSRIAIVGHMISSAYERRYSNTVKGDESFEVYKRISALCATVPISAIRAFLATCTFSILLSLERRSFQAGVQGADARRVSVMRENFILSLTRGKNKAGICQKNAIR